MYLLIYILYILLIIRKNKNKFYINIIYIESQQTFFMYVCTSLPRPVTCHMVTMSFAHAHEKPISKVVLRSSNIGETYSMLDRKGGNRWARRELVFMASWCCIT